MKLVLCALGGERGIEKLLLCGRFDSNISPTTYVQNLATMLPRLDPVGFDLLSKMLVYEPSKRISAGTAVT